MKKTLLAAAAFVCVVASPAFAQSYDPDVGTGNTTQWYDNLDRLHPNPELNSGAYGAYAYDPFSYGAYGYNLFYDPYYGAYGAYGPAPKIRHGHRHSAR
jgi:hypothetical protein